MVFDPKVQFFENLQSILTDLIYWIRLTSSFFPCFFDDIFDFHAFCEYENWISDFDISGQQTTEYRGERSLRSKSTSLTHKFFFFTLLFCFASFSRSSFSSFVTVLYYFCLRESRYILTLGQMTKIRVYTNHNITQKAPYQEISNFEMVIWIPCQPRNETTTAATYYFMFSQQEK